MLGLTCILPWIHLDHTLTIFVCSSSCPSSFLSWFFLSSDFPDMSSTLNRWLVHDRKIDTTPCSEWTAQEIQKLQAMLYLVRDDSLNDIYKESNDNRQLRLSINDVGKNIYFLFLTLIIALFSYWVRRTVWIYKTDTWFLKNNIFFFFNSWQWMTGKIWNYWSKDRVTSINGMSLQPCIVTGIATR